MHLQSENVNPNSEEDFPNHLEFVSAKILPILRKNV